MSKKRATQAELIKRREEIQQLILKGVSGSDIQEQMSIKWETSKRAIADDMRSIAKEWEDKATETTQLMRNKYADRLEMLLNKALQEGHIKTALEVQKEIHKLNGMYKEKEAAEDKAPQFIKVSKRSLKVVGEEDEQKH